jgi:hypothetical protein
MSRWHSVGWEWMTKGSWQDRITRLCVIDAFSSKSFWFCRMLKALLKLHWEKKTGMSQNYKTELFSLSLLFLVMMLLIIDNAKSCAMYHVLIINNKVSKTFVWLHFAFVLFLLFPSVTQYLLRSGFVSVSLSLGAAIKRNTIPLLKRHNIYWKK